MIDDKIFVVEVLMLVAILSFLVAFVTVRILDKKTEKILARVEEKKAAKKAGK